MFIDSHCHLLHTFPGGELTSFLSSLEGKLEYLIDISTNKTEFLNIRQFSLPHFLLLAYGLYPDQAVDFSPAMDKEFRETLDGNPVQALGEVGLDYYWDYGNPVQQEKLFRHQIEYAIEQQLPLIVHSRDAFADTHRILAEYRFSRNVILHCFGYGREEAEKFLNLGFIISFAGNLTYKNAHSLHEAAQIVPLDRLLFETDSPYLTPVPHRGKPNLPFYVEHVYRFFAQTREIELDNLVQQVSANFRRIFHLPAV